MAKKCIAIEYSSELCRAVQVCLGKDKLIVEKTARITSDKYQQLAAGLLAAGFNLSLPAVFTASSRNCHFANIATNASSEMPGDDTDCNCPPVHIDNAIRIHLPGEHKLPGGQTTCLTVTTDKTELETIVKLAGENKLHCQKIELPIFALLATIAGHSKNDDQNMVLYHNDDRLIIAAYEKENLTLVRNMPMPGTDPENIDIIIRETKLTWRSAFGGQIPENSTIILAGELPGNDFIEQFKAKCQCQIQEVDITQKYDFLEVPDQPGQFTIATGAGWLFLDPNNKPDLNLIKSVIQTADKGQNTNNLAITTALILLIMIVALVQVTSKNATYTDNHNTLITAIDKLFNENMPELKDKAAGYDSKRKLAILEETFKANSQLTGQYAMLAAPKTDIIALMSKLAKKLPETTKYSSMTIQDNKVSLTAYSQNSKALEQLSNELATDSSFKLISSEPGEQNKQTINIKLEIVKVK